MKVKELRNLLYNCDDDAEVMIGYQDSEPHAISRVVNEITLTEPTDSVVLLKVDY